MYAAGDILCIDAGRHLVYKQFGIRAVDVQCRNKFACAGYDVSLDDVLI